MEGSSSSGRELRCALIVDDDVVNRKIHEKLLNNAGVRNESVRNGKEAIDIHCAGQRFDLILMDLDMPIMNGIEATRQLRAMGVESKIAGVSAGSTEARVQEFMEAGLDLFLEKPLTSAKLSLLLHKH